MRERVALLDGLVAVESAHGAGTRLKIRLPIPDGAYV
jgi:signal transduction histidine kinase